ncbi:MAG: glycoside hydrolase family 5 protein [Symploca sp. SIO2D2]|nr:glycoside hydrolase family 5 protein [Symploca sp. SIO2D2]
MNTGKGFFVKDGRIFDPNGVEFIPMGCNAAVFWDGRGDCKLRSLSEYIPNAGANTVRLVTLTPPEFNEANAWAWNASHRMHQEMVRRCVESGLVPMLEMHDATCRDPHFDAIAAYWKSPETVQLCKDYEEHLFINLANEHDFPTAEDWRDEYSKLIGDLRALGVRNPIVLDASGTCGQDPDVIKLYGREVLESDPERNVIFSVHMYIRWRTEIPERVPDGWRFIHSVEQEIAWFRENAFPLIIGEFGWHEPMDPGNSVGFRGDLVIETLEKHGYGWYFWSWNEELYPKDQYYCMVKNPCSDGSPETLTPAGEYIIPYWKAKAKRASHFE